MSATPAVNPRPSIQEAAATQRYWDDHYAELLEQFPEQFVAVRDGTVVASHRDLAMLLYDLQDRGLDARTDVAIEFVTSRADRLQL